MFGREEEIEGDDIGGK